MVTIKAWTRLGTAVAFTAGSLSASAHIMKLPAVTPAQLHFVDTAGEGEGEEVADLDDAAFTAKLGYVLGHMRVGTALYGKGEVAMAKTHMKHPRDEIYVDLEPVLKERKSPGFAKELDALSAAVEAGAPVSDVDEKFNALESALQGNLPSFTASLAAQAAQQMVRTAAEEYAIGVKDGMIVELHEYQDAWGFVETAKVFMAALSSAERSEHKAEIENIEAQLQSLSALWPDIVGKAQTKGEAKQLFAAAATIELQALSIK